MVELLQDLKENHHVKGIKAEFEAEGTRLEESMRLKEIITKAGLDLTIKIGGCEAIRDLYEARILGVTRIVAPMIESSYALKKFLTATKQIFPEEERDAISLLINIETIDGYQKFQSMLEIEEIGELDGIVLGRVDMTGSMGRTREYVNSEEIFNLTNNLFSLAKSKGLECIIGGGLSNETIPFLRNLSDGLVDGYETRKVIFQCPEALDEGYDIGILKAISFELMWLKNKRNFYGMIFEEDRTRIDMLQKRYDKLQFELGGMLR